MEKDENNFSAERIDEIRKNIDFSDIPEIKDLSGGKFKNLESQKIISINIDLDHLDNS